MIYRNLSLALLVVATAGAACKSKQASEERIALGALGLSVPKPSGWQQDETVTLQNQDLARPGVALRLMQDASQAGAPRITVVAQSLSPKAQNLEAFVKSNLQEMAKLEDQGLLRITQVKEALITLDGKPAHQVRHEYSMGHAGGETPLTQITTLVVHNNIGITVSASGQTPLFQPQEATVMKALTGIRFTTPGAAKPPAKTPPSPEPQTPPGTPTVDLGTIGDQ